MSMYDLSFPKSFPEKLKAPALEEFEKFKKTPFCFNKPERIEYFFRFIGNADNQKDRQAMKDFWYAVEKRIPLNSPMDGTPTFTVGSVFARFTWAFYTWHTRPQISKKMYRKECERAYGALIKLNNIMKGNALIKAQMDGYCSGHLAEKLNMKRVPAGVNFKDLIENIIAKVDDSGKNNEMSYEFVPAHLFAKSTKRSPKKVHFAALFEELAMHAYGKKANAEATNIMSCVMTEFDGISTDDVRPSYRKAQRIRDGKRKVSPRKKAR